MLDNIFLQQCADTLAATNSPLSGAKIAKIMGAYSIDYGVSVPDTITIEQEPNKRSLLFDYLKCFSTEQQVDILHELCESQAFEGYAEKNSIINLRQQIDERIGEENLRTIHVSPKTVQARNRASKMSKQVLREIISASNDEKVEFKSAVMNCKVFVSHSSKDADIINAFKTHILIAGIGLSDNNIICTSFEETGISAGDNIPKYIEENIGKADVVLCMVSQSYKHSEICQNEVGAAWALKKNIIQIILPDCSFNSVGWLLNLDKAIKIEKSASLDNLQEKVCQIFNLTTKSARLWNPHVNNFLSAISSLIKNYSNKIDEKVTVPQISKNEIKEFDKSLFSRFDSKWSESEIISIVDNIIRSQKYDEYQADFLEDLEYNNKYEENHFINEDIQESLNKLCDAISKLLIFLSMYYTPSRINWNSKSLDGLDDERINEIKRQRMHVWHENYDLPDDLYQERYRLMCTKLPTFGNAIVEAYKKFRKVVKQNLLV